MTQLTTQEGAAALAASAALFALPAAAFVLRRLSVVRKDAE